MHFDGRDPAREGSGMLKRLLEPAMGQQMPPMGAGPQGAPNHLMDQLEPPRPKKKRTQQKKAGADVFTKRADVVRRSELICPDFSLSQLEWETSTI